MPGPSLIHSDGGCFLRAYGDLWWSCADHIDDVIKTGNLEVHWGIRGIAGSIRGSFCKFQKMRMRKRAEDFTREHLWRLGVLAVGFVEDRIRDHVVAVEQ